MGSPSIPRRIPRVSTQVSLRLNGDALRLPHSTAARQWFVRQRGLLRALPVGSIHKDSLPFGHKIPDVVPVTRSWCLAATDIICTMSIPITLHIFCQFPKFSARALFPPLVPIKLGPRSIRLEHLLFVGHGVRRSVGRGAWGSGHWSGFAPYIPQIRESEVRYALSRIGPLHCTCPHFARREVRREVSTLL